MFAKIVFDLPLEKSFDYLIPSHLRNRIAAGVCVKVTLGTKKLTGIVLETTDKSAFERLKEIKFIDEQYPPLDSSQIAIAFKLNSYYGCSLGQAFFTILRGCRGQIMTQPTLPQKTKLSLTLHLVPSGDYQQILVELIKPLNQKNERVLILVPDQYVAFSIDQALKKYLPQNSFIIGTRSLVFRSLADIALVILIDESNSSYKQEQTPMYDTRDVLLMRARKENLEVAFISALPSVEMMNLVDKGEIQIKELPFEHKVKAQVVDLNNYKTLFKGILSPAVVSGLESNFNKKLKSVLVFNHRGSFAMTRCSECGLILKCQRCDSSMVYSRIKKQYVCRHCSFHLLVEEICPTCQKPSWKSFGLGIEQLQKALQDKFPLAKIEAFERGMEEPTKNFDILIGTVALLRFKDRIRGNLVAFLDIDGELNRLDVRSCYRAFAMAQEVRNLAQEQYFIQSLNPDHYVIQALVKDNKEIFYREDMRIRKELEVCPFGHQVSIQIRHKNQKLVETTAEKFYQVLSDKTSLGIQVHEPVVEGTFKKRDFYRMNILLQGREVAAMIAFIKKALQDLKRLGKIIIIFNVDP